VGGGTEQKNGKEGEIKNSYSSTVLPTQKKKYIKKEL
jgi:hypothetical protein